jgi:hypothetical protein
LAQAHSGSTLLRMGSDPTEKRFLTRWIVANSAGWLLGVVVVLLLAALLESTHFGNAVYLGAGMGWSVGFAQWLIARKWFDATSGWMWASTIGITTPFLFADLVRMRDLSSLVLPVLAAAGGLLSGLMQISSLRSHSAKADRWVVVSAVAWMCPALLVQFVAVPRHPRTTLESVRNIGSLGLGGVVLGAVTGAALVWLLNVRERSASA